MSDYIDRHAAIDAVHKSIFDFFDICDDDEESPMTYKDERLLELNKAITIQIKAVPSADAVEVVRCKDCKYYYYADNRIPSERGWACANDGCYSSQNDYCSWGERIDG